MPEKAKSYDPEVLMHLTTHKASGTLLRFKGIVVLVFDFNRLYPNLT